MALSLHRDSIVIDAVCPLVMENPEYIDWYIAGGATAVAPTVGSTESSDVVIHRLAAWHRWVRERADLMLVASADDIAAAKQQGRLGIYFHIQGSDPIGGNLDLIDLYKALGVGMIQLTYNERNRVGDGCEEPGNAGLSRFGARLVDRLNAARIIVDCSHVGERTALDAIDRSSTPVVLSHSNVGAVHDSPRNVSDALIRAVAGRGGVIGIVGFPGMVSEAVRPSLEQLLCHIDALVQRVGIGHVALGLDYYAGQAGVLSDDAALASYNQSINAGIWTTAYPPPPHVYPTGIETPSTLQNLTLGLAARGYGDTDIRKILGENWLELFRRVWEADMPRTTSQEVSCR
jgi:membrane dipeptidase